MEPLHQTTLLNMNLMENDFLRVIGQFPKVHIRIEKRNARKSITSVQMLDRYVSATQVCDLVSKMKKKFNCNGTVIHSDEYGTVAQFQGDQRGLIKDYLVKEGILKDDDMIIHGF